MRSYSSIPRLDVACHAERGIRRRYAPTGWLAMTRQELASILAHAARNRRR